MCTIGPCLRRSTGARAERAESRSGSRTRSQPETVLELLTRDPAGADQIGWIRELPWRVRRQLASEATYSGYMCRQQLDVQKVRSEEGLSLVGIDFDRVRGLSNEVRTTLMAVAPRTLWRGIAASRRHSSVAGGYPGGAAQTCRWSWMIVGASREALPDDIRIRLESFVRQLLRWNRTINLISRSDETAVWERHVLDALQLAAWIPPDVKRAIDLGSGAGFPGLILAIACDFTWELVEPDTRKAAFLRLAALETCAPVRIHPVRAEDLRIAPARLITARGFASINRVLSVGAPLLEERGECLLLKGRQAQDELTTAHRRWQMDATCWPSRTDGGHIVLLRGNPRCRSLGASLNSTPSRRM